MVDFASMTVEELIAYKRDRKEDIELLKAEIDEAQGYYVALIEAQHVSEAIAQVTQAAANAGRTPEEQAQFWFNEGDDGHRINARRFLTGKVNGQVKVVVA